MIMPLSIVRWISFHQEAAHGHSHVRAVATFTVAVIFSLSGVWNTILYTLTRIMDVGWHQASSLQLHHDWRGLGIWIKECDRRWSIWALMLVHNTWGILFHLRCVTLPRNFYTVKVHSELAYTFRYHWWSYASILRDWIGTSQLKWKACPESTRNQSAALQPAWTHLTQRKFIYDSYMWLKCYACGYFKLIKLGIGLLWCQKFNHIWGPLG